MASLFSDNHDIIAMRMYEIEFTRTEKQGETNRDQVVPQAQHYAAPRGKYSFFIFSIDIISSTMPFPVFRSHTRSSTISFGRHENRFTRGRCTNWCGSLPGGGRCYRTKTSGNIQKAILLI